MSLSFFTEIIFEMPTVEMGFKFWDVGYRKKMGREMGQPFRNDFSLCHLRRGISKVTTCPQLCWIPGEHRNY